MTKDQFKLLCAPTPQALEEAVNLHLQEGWKLLQGGYQAIQETARVEISPDTQNPMQGMASQTKYTINFTIALFK